MFIILYYWLESVWCDLLSTVFLNSLWASSFSWNARDGADSQVLGVTLGVKLIFVFSATFGIKGLWGWFVARELFEKFRKLLFRWNINFLSFFRGKVGFNFYSVTYSVRVPSVIYQEKILHEFNSWCPKTIWVKFLANENKKEKMQTFLLVF